MIATKPARAPISAIRCPEHGQLVGVDGEGRLVGRCAGCANAASLGIRIIERGAS